MQQEVIRSIANLTELKRLLENEVQKVNKDIEFYHNN